MQIYTLGADLRYPAQFVPHVLSGPPAQPEQALVWHWQPDTGPDLAHVLDWRLQGYRGPVALTGNWDREEIIESADWLEPLPEGVSIVPMDQINQWLSDCTALSNDAWQAAAQQALRQRWRVLRHDWQSLTQTQATAPLIQRLEKQVAAEIQFWPTALNPIWPVISHDLQGWQESLKHWSAQPEAADARTFALSTAKKVLQILDSEAQATQARPPMQVLIQLERHWQALLKQYTHLLVQQDERKIEFKEAALALGLRAWFEKYPLETLQDADTLIYAANDLQTLMQARPVGNRRGPLSQLIHNTLDQHMYTVASLLSVWLPSLRSWQGLQANRLFGLSHLPDLIQAAQQKQTEIIEPETQWQQWRVSDPKSSRQVILILEDNPVWAQEIADQTGRALSRFLKDRPGQSYRDWQIQIIDQLDVAEQFAERPYLLISDLSLPRQRGQTPLRSNGVRFLKAQLNRLKGVPVIVHTTPTWYLEDQQELSALGIQDLDFVFKTDPNGVEERVYQWLQTLRQRPTYWLQTEPLALNDVALDLSPLNQSLMRVFADGRRYSPREVVAGLIDQGHQEYQTLLDQDAADTVEKLPAPCELWLKGLPAELVPLARNRLLILQQTALALDPDLSPQQKWTAVNQTLTKTHFAVAQELQQGLWSKLPQAMGLSWPELMTLFCLHNDVLGKSTSSPTESELNTQVSKWLSALKKMLKQQFQAVHQTLDLDALLLAYSPTAQAHLSGLRPEQRGQNLYQLDVRLSPGVSNRRKAWQVLLVENDPEMAETMREQLDSLARLRGLNLQVAHIPHLEALQALLNAADWLPDLVLLDLHIPLSAAEYANDPRAGHPQGGYRVLTQLRQHLQAQAPEHVYRVLVTSSLADDDLGRQEGIKLGVATRNYLPKGRDYQGLVWPDSLRLRLDRLLQELQQALTVPDPIQLDLRSRALPIAVRVEKFSGDHLVLSVRAALARHPEAVSVVLRRKRAELMLHLLRAWPAPLGWEQACKLLGCASEQLKNHRNRLRKTDMADWPLDWLTKYTPESPGNLVLVQESVGPQTSLRLNIAEVQDPEGLLLAVLEQPSGIIGGTNNASPHGSAQGDENSD